MMEYVEIGTGESMPTDRLKGQVSVVRAQRTGTQVDTGGHHRGLSLDGRTWGRDSDSRQGRV